MSVFCLSNPQIFADKTPVLHVCKKAILTTPVPRYTIILTKKTPNYMEYMNYIKYMIYSNYIKYMEYMNYIIYMIYLKYMKYLIYLKYMIYLHPLKYTFMLFINH